MTPKPPIPMTLPDLTSLTASAGLPMTLSMTSLLRSAPRVTRRQGGGASEGASNTESGLASRSSVGVRYCPDKRS
jgi:hypothetical protein